MLMVRIAPCINVMARMRKSIMKIALALYMRAGMTV